MPIIDVEIVGPIPEDVRRGLARRIADLTGKALDSNPQGTWVKLRFVDEENYSENEGPDPGVRPAIVSVLLAQAPAGEELARQASDLATAVGEACNRSVQNVHVLFEPSAAGRIAFGGQLLE